MFPGTLQAYYDANIYSRVPGYVHAWYQDIGAHVKKDELLATIDTPELDQQIGQARADLSAAVGGPETVRRHRRALGKPAAAGCRLQSRTPRQGRSPGKQDWRRSRRPRPISTGFWR